MTTYTWTISELLTVPQEAGHADVVVEAVWVLTGSDSPYSASVGGTSQFTLQQGEGFTPYDQLTEAQVIGWVQAQVGQEAISNLEASIANSIDTQKNPAPTPTPQPLPWTQE